MNIYSVINIDIVKSREIDNRDEFQIKLSKYIENLNEKYANILLAPITMTLGDEWQIILMQPKESYHVIDRFQELFRGENLKIYAGIGIGTISTKIYKDTRMMDGECFIKAREALEITKNRNTFYNKRINSRDNRVYFNADNVGFNNLVDNDLLDEVAVTNDDVNEDALTLNKMINTLIENNEVLKSKFTKKQMDIINLYKNNKSYSNILKVNKNLSKSDISQKLNASNYFLVDSNNRMIENLLNAYCNIRKEY
ncbi:hypothetical protein SH2C18_00130 [Clostridium sediminicola]|uniref:SatD family protein n=1 Tax=Clostridium sediminicola TaxID=3114879 RepID=UPI0031F2166E